MMWELETQEIFYFLWLCLFFFKQKTAYEMRISDWSSDVCSSDLTQVRVLEDVLQDAYLRAREKIGQLRDPQALDAWLTPSSPQIGRASCRARACQYV